MQKEYRDLSSVQRILLGPGPSNVHPRILKAMATPLLGHLDPEFLEIMNETKDLLRWLFQTENQLTIPMSGTGSLGMETCFVNALEPGDTALICVNGVFGQRMVDNAARCGAQVDTVTAPWGKPIDLRDVRKALAEKAYKLLAVVHAETSTGVLQPLGELSQMAKENGALFLVDTVTSLGGCPVNVDEMGIDLCYSGTQKCLGIPPSLAPVTFSDKGLKNLKNRRTKVQSWYQDLNMIASYWGQERVYHHTAPISAIFALREGLRIIYEEGLQARIDRHRTNAAAFWAGLEAMGLQLLVEEQYRAPSLTTVRVPEGIDELYVRKKLLSKHNIEIGGGLGDLKGKIWRVGLMGENSHANSVFLLLSALSGILEGAGFACSTKEALVEAGKVYGE